MKKLSIEFDHVTFVYPDGEEPVLQDVSFKANKGEMIALLEVLVLVKVH